MRRAPESLRNFAATSAPHGLRTLVEHAATLMGLELNVVAKTNAMSVQKSLVLGGHGLTILPTIAVADDFARGQLAGAPLIEPALQRRIVLATSSNRHTTTPVRCVVAELVKCMHGAVHRGDWRAAKWLGE
jgi:DNA-binding transcriptional LysR family regulator